MAKKAENPDANTADAPQNAPAPNTADAPAQNQPVNPLDTHTMDYAPREPQPEQKTVAAKDIRGNKVSTTERPKGPSYNEKLGTHLVYSYGRWQHVTESQLRSHVTDLNNEVVLPKDSKFDADKLLPTKKK